MLINILTRASGRTKGFKKCYESIANQTYKNVRHIVTYDCDDDLSYLNTYAVEKIKVDKEILIQNDVSEQHENYSYFPYNLYCNELLKEVKSGWVLFLDDDDMLAHKHVLVEIVANLKRSSQDTLFIWQMKYPDGRIKPRIGLLFRKEIRWSQIGSPCFLFHSSYAHRAQWDAWKSADYRFVKRLSEFIPNTKVIAKPMILLNNHGGKGKRKDIVL
ncbi:MAG: glycosyltransferase family A protein [Flavobacteriales bacterium]